MEKLNQWLTLAANFGVLGGLIVVAIELQQTTEAIELTQKAQAASAFQDRAYRFSEKMELLATSPDLAELYDRSYRSPGEIEELDPVERRRLWAWEMSMRSHWENMVMQSDLGFEDYMLGTDFADGALLRYSARWRQLEVPIPSKLLQAAIEAADARQSPSN